MARKIIERKRASAIFQHDRVTVHHGDCLKVMAAMPEASVDSIVTDPPYGLEFMGKEWDKLGAYQGPRPESEKAFPAANKNRVRFGKSAASMQSWHEAWASAALRVAKPGAILMAFGGCYDAETEVLTRRGWIPFPDVTMIDEFASLNLQTELVEFQRPTEVVRFKHNGQMHYYHTNRVNLLVTPNHKMLIASIRKSIGMQWRLVPSSDVPVTSRMTKTSKGLTEAKHNVFVVTGAYRGKGHGHYEQMPCVLIPAEIWAAFLGLWMAEGHATSTLNWHGGASTHVAITHFNKANIDEMTIMLRPYFNVRLYPGSGRLRINDPRLYKQFAHLGKAGTKRLPDYVKSWSPSLIRILLDWYARGDGDREGRIYTASKALADDVQEIAMYAGLAADVSVRPPKDSMIEGRHVKAHYPQYVIRVLTAQMKPEIYARHKKAAVKTVVSAAEWNSQEVYCVEVPKHHTLYVRRRGKAVWCGNTRTFHRLACAIEDAGWNVIDCMMWLQGQGFPKSHNISKAIDKAAGAVREKIGKHNAPAKSIYSQGEVTLSDDVNITAPATEAAKLWDGWGTALKPSYEPIIVAMKPLDGTFAHNAVEHGVAGLWIDGGRVGTAGENPTAKRRSYGFTPNTEKAAESEARGVMRDRSDPIAKAASHPSDNLGRWPANLVLSHSPDCVLVGTEPDPGYKLNTYKGRGPFGDSMSGHEYETTNVPAGEREVYACVPGCPVRMLDEQSGQSSTKAGGRNIEESKTTKVYGWAKSGGIHKSGVHFGDSGGASRFFYTAKASTTERILGCPPGYQNRHPTVKPLDLCRYLCRLTRTPTGGVVLDPFSGSGSIAVAALLEGRTAIAIELEEESARATVTRVEAALKWGDKLQSLRRYRMKGRKKLRKRR